MTDYDRRVTTANDGVQSRNECRESSTLSVDFIGNGRRAWVDSDRCLRLELSELAEVVSRVDSSLAMTWTNRNNNAS